jgi:hypothetical protein
VRLGLGEPVRLAVVGAAFGAGFFLSWLAAMAAVGTPPGQIPFWEEDSWLEATIRSLVLGYTVTLAAIGYRTGARCLDELRPHLVGGEEQHREARRALVDVRVSALRAAGVLGAITLPVLALGDAVDIIGWGPHYLPSVAWLGLLGWVLFRTVMVHLHVARVLSGVGGQRIDIELLDLRPLAPLVAWGLQIVLVWAVWFAILSLFFIGPGPVNLGNWLGIIPLLVMAVGALVLPVRGVHRRIRAAKRAELDRLRAAIVAERERGLASDAEASPRLANLVAYHGLVASVQEWPFDVATWLRFGLYVAIGAGSWVGAALVERLLERALG